MNVDYSVSDAIRNVWKANWTDRQTHTVIIVHTCGWCKISILNLLKIVVFDNYNLHNYFFQINIDCEFWQFYTF